MKKVIGKQRFANAEELVEAVGNMIHQAQAVRKSQDGSKLWQSEVDCDFGDAETIALIEETLTDGSIVYNLELR